MTQNLRTDMHNTQTWSTDERYNYCAEWTFCWSTLGMCQLISLKCECYNYSKCLNNSKKLALIKIYSVYYSATWNLTYCEAVKWTCLTFFAGGGGGGVGGSRVVWWCWVNFQCRGVLLIWIIVGQGPTALAVGASGGCLDIFSAVYHFSPLSPSLWEKAQ